MKTNAILAFGVGCAIAVAPAGAHGESRDVGPEGLERVYYDGVDEHGNLTGGMVLLPRPDLQALMPGPGAAWTTILDNGPSSNRLDIVFVGDGYLESELGLYAGHVINGLDNLLTQEPFLSYSTYFNVHRVDVISNESGVDNDPVPGILRDTALDMGFWCNNIERLLCVNVSAAYQYANNAPDVEAVLAVANSTKYGGAGYSSSDLVTYSGGNSAAPEVAIHEMGHSLGNLADEYDYGDGVVYMGPERPEPNVSILTDPERAAAGTKWANWLGDPGIGFGGLVSTYEGAYYSEFGIYRPTVNSKMRSLNQPFNLPSIESLIIQIYVIVDPIDDATPSGTLSGTETVFVDPIDPANHVLEVQWSLDGDPIAGATGTDLDLEPLGLGIGAYELAVTVTDPTQFVRDEAARAFFLSETRLWNVVVPQPGDANGDFNVDLADLLIVLALWGPCDDPCPPCFADLDGDCQIGITDFLLVLRYWT